MRSFSTNFKLVAVLLLIGVLLFGQACTVRKYLPANTYLLDKVNIRNAPANTKDELYNLSKQVPNKKIFGFWKINMWSYLLANKNKIRKNKEDRLKRLQLKYTAKEEALQSVNANSRKGRKLKKQVAALQVKIDNQRNKIDDLKKSIWEEPVLLDTSLCALSARQMQASLFNKGYFHDTVTYTVSYRTHKRKATVSYFIEARDPFFIRSVDYYIFDKRIAGIVAKDTLNSLVHPGMQYDGEVLSKERDRLTLLLRDNGYYNFSHEYIYVEVDSAISGNYVNIGLGIANPSNEERHRLYKIRNIYMEPEFVLGDTTAKDSVKYGDVTFLSNRPIVRRSVLAGFVYFKPGRLYRTTEYQRTISKLSQIPLFRFIDIQYQVDTSNRSDTGLLDVFIRLSPAKKLDYTYTLELNSTEESLAQIQNSTTRSMGAATSVAFRNKNLWHDALTFQFSPQAAVELPISLLRDTRVIDTPNIIYGFNASLIFPHLLLPRNLKEKYAKRNVQTSLNFDFLHEENKYYYRATINTNLTYLIARRNIRQYITPFEISLVDARFRSDNFGNKVKATQDPLLINLFDRHLITDFRYIFLYNQQPLVLVKKHLFYFREAVETGGNLPALAGKLTSNNSKNEGALTNSVAGINYFQYLKTESDFRFYIPIGTENNLALRTILGFGIPYGNSYILPFEKRFFVGGANSIRAWKLREIGPGSFTGNSDEAVNFDHSGDFKYEANAELRFPVYGVLKGALFLDAGNVWTFKNDPARPGTQFQINRFYKELAIGTGFGTRFDFSVFLFRLDFGIRLHDPSLPEGERWLIKDMNESDWIGHFMSVNLGIGYPF